MSTEAHVAAFLAAQLAVLVGGWQFVVWVRGLVREETRAILARLDKIEERIEGCRYAPGARSTPAPCGPEIGP